MTTIPTADEVVTKLQNIITKSNNATGASDTDITSAVNRLIQRCGSDVRANYDDIDVSANPLTAKIQRLIDTINSVTSQTDNTLTTAIDSLIKGGSKTDILYKLSSPVTLNTYFDAINTGVKLWENDIDFTIAVKATRPVAAAAERPLFACRYPQSPYNGIISAFGNANYEHPYIFVVGKEFSTDELVEFEYPYNYAGDIALVVTHFAGSEYKVKHLYNDEIFEATINMDFCAHSTPLWIGSNPEAPTRWYWLGDINDFQILSRAMTDEEIHNYLGVTPEEAT